MRAALKISGDAFGLPLTKVEWKDPQGRSVPCLPVQGGCIIRDSYSATGVLMASTHEFEIAGQGRASGTYTAIASYGTRQFGNACGGPWDPLFTDTFTTATQRPPSHRPTSQYCTVDWYERNQSGQSIA